MTEESDRPIREARYRIVDLVFARQLPGARWAAFIAAAVAIVAHAVFLGWAVSHRQRPTAPPIEGPTVELAEAPPPPPPPPSPPPPAPEPAPPVRVAPVRVPHAPPPPPAQAGKIVAQEPDPKAPVDLGDKGFVTGTGQTYAGGYTTSSGTSTKPVDTRDVDPSSHAAPSGAPDLSSPGGLLDSDWTCPWPREADDLEVDEQVVMMRVTVRPDGTAERAQALRDPGAGFGAAAVACAERARFQPPHDASGKPIRGTLPPIRLRFTR